MEATGERLSNGRFVAAPVKLLATHRGELAGLPPTGRFVIVHAVFYCELDPRRRRLLRVRGLLVSANLTHGGSDAYLAAVQDGGSWLTAFIDEERETALSIKL